MTVETAPDVPAEAGPDAPRPGRRARRSARRADRRRARQAARKPRATGVFAGVTFVFVGLLGVMLWQGWETAKEVKGANRLEQEADPDAPGFQAEVRPTPTRLIGQLDDDGGLADLVLLAEGPGGAGGAAVFIPGTTAVERGGEFLRLWEVYEREGWPAVVDSVGRFLGAGFSETAVLDPTQATEMLGTAGALSVENPDDVVVDDEEEGRTTEFEAGTLTLEPADAVRFMTTVGRGESELNRSFRQQLVWEAWLDRLAELGAGARPDVAPLGGGDRAVDLAEVVPAMAQGFVSTEPLPLVRVPIRGPNAFPGDAPDPEGIAELVPRVIPFPQSAFPGQRPRVRVLNGTETDDLELLASAAVVRAGGQVVIVGNADSFGEAETTVEYHDPARAEEAREIAAALGVSGATRSQAQTDAFDVTVTLGSDLGG